jgi:hypothetical protein
MSKKNIQQRKCSVNGCEKKHSGKGYCGMHYQRYIIRKIIRPKIIYSTLDSTDSIKINLFSKRAFDPKKGCWEWQGGMDKDGYGKIQIESKSLRVHRVSAMIYLGFDINSKLQVCHKCDNPCCFNPEHLFIGSDRDNKNDMKNKQRTKGSRNRSSLLTEEDVVEIKKMIRSGFSQSVIARSFGVSKYTISNIKTKKSWTHVKVAGD